MIGIDDELGDEQERDAYAPIDDLPPLPDMPEPWPEFATPQQQGKAEIKQLRQTVEALPKVDIDGTENQAGPERPPHATDC